MQTTHGSDNSLVRSLPGPKGALLGSCDLYVMFVPLPVLISIRSLIVAYLTILIHLRWLRGIQKTQGRLRKAN